MREALTKAAILAAVMGAFFLGYDAARQEYQPMACEMRVIDTIRVPTRLPERTK